MMREHVQNIFELWIELYYNCSSDARGKMAMISISLQASQFILLAVIATFIKSSDTDWKKVLILSRALR
jgi:hypothetical protein